MSEFRGRRTNDGHRGGPNSQPKKPWKNRSANDSDRSATGSNHGRSDRRGSERGYRGSEHGNERGERRDHNPRQGRYDGPSTNRSTRQGAEVNRRSEHSTSDDRRGPRSTDRREYRHSDRPHQARKDPREAGQRNNDRGDFRDRRQSNAGSRRNDSQQFGENRRNDRPYRTDDDKSQSRYADVVAPPLPEEIQFADLDDDVQRELRTLPKDLAEIIGKHLVAAGQLMDEDPQAALAHAKYAKVKASRVPAVREALGLVAYQAGEWATALSELRAVRRMTHTDLHIAIIADAERALGRPERALDIAKEANTARLPKATQVELNIVAAGARRDLGQVDAAVVALQGADLDAQQRHPWSARLFYAYADNLAAANRIDEAVEWFLHAADADEYGETDAPARVTELSHDG